ncbi:glutathione peroxidase [Salinimicrobium sp. MT39]|uniref:Glutathione peroxidase n=1 Tax=Salinimicrobium profundisediminis TaxID=2994553 RepID=A0A9X3CYC8_9FLAO|nr:glutathione peroxidase [Salinimicrobium profundisediminis]MCX2837819.1 glutathione peroxidase [Salinimicrobium profundisediminis]
MKNRSTTVKSQSLKQKVLRFMYPLIRKLGKKGENGTVLTNEQKSQPLTSLHNLKVDLNTGKTLELQEFKGKKLILVNTASNCGYTGQYSELQSLQERYGNSLQVIAFPANDFAEQEKSDDNEIAEFCQMNYGVTFPVAKKSVVVKNEEQQELFKWLTSKDLNGWNQHAPDWNFSKYIVDENGLLTHYFGPSISPLEEQFLRALE